MYPFYSSSHSDTLSTADLTKSKNGRVGLDNLGNTCYMNTGLQCLSHIPELTKLFLTEEYKNCINSKNHDGSQGNVAKSFYTFLTHMWLSTHGTYNPSSLKGMIGQYCRDFAGYQQHDCQEFILRLLDILHEDLNSVTNRPYIDVPEYNYCSSEFADYVWNYHLSRNDSPLIPIFYGQIATETSCPQCHKVAVNFDPINCYSLSLPSEKSHININTISIDLVHTHINHDFFSLEIFVDDSAIVILDAIETKYNIKRNQIMLVEFEKNYHDETTYSIIDESTVLSEYDQSSYRESKYIVAYLFHYEITESMIPVCIYPSVLVKSSNRYGSDLNYECITLTMPFFIHVSDQSTVSQVYEQFINENKDLFYSILNENKQSFINDAEYRYTTYQEKMKKSSLRTTVYGNRYNSNEYTPYNSSSRNTYMNSYSNNHQNNFPNPSMESKVSFPNSILNNNSDSDSDSSAHLISQDNYRQQSIQTNSSSMDRGLSSSVSSLPPPVASNSNYGPSWTVQSNDNFPAPSTLSSFIDPQLKLNSDIIPIPPPYPSQDVLNSIHTHVDSESEHSSISKNSTETHDTTEENDTQNQRNSMNSGLLGGSQQCISDHNHDDDHNMNNNGYNNDHNMNNHSEENSNTQEMNDIQKPMENQQEQYSNTNNTENIPVIHNTSSNPITSTCVSLPTTVNHAISSPPVVASPVLGPILETPTSTSTLSASIDRKPILNNQCNSEQTHNMNSTIDSTYTSNKDINLSNSNQHTESHVTISSVNSLNSTNDVIPKHVHRETPTYFNSNNYNWPSTSDTSNQSDDEEDMQFDIHDTTTNIQNERMDVSDTEDNALKDNEETMLNNQDKNVQYNIKRHITESQRNPNFISNKMDTRDESQQQKPNYSEMFTSLPYYHSDDAFGYSNMNSVNNYYEQFMNEKLKLSNPNQYSRNYSHNYNEDYATKPIRSGYYNSSIPGLYIIGAIIDNTTNDYNRIEDVLPKLSPSLNSLYSLTQSQKFVDIHERISERDSTNNSIRLEDCFMLSSQIRKLDENNKWYCNQCKEHVCAENKTVLWRLPSVLIIQLKRFKYSRGSHSTYRYDYGGEKRKIETLVQFPLENLDLRPYLANEIQEQEKNTLYDLICVANHSGGANFGHYYAYCRDDNDGIPQWFEYNDSYVSPMRPESVCRSTAYVLVYRRKNTCLKSNDLLKELLITQKDLQKKEEEEQKSRPANSFMNSVFPSHCGYNQKNEQTSQNQHCVNKILVFEPENGSSIRSHPLHTSSIFPDGDNNRHSISSDQEIDNDIDTNTQMNSTSYYSAQESMPILSNIHDDNGFPGNFNPEPIENTDNSEKSSANDFINNMSDNEDTIKPNYDIY